MVLHTLCDIATGLLVLLVQSRVQDLVTIRGASPRVG